MSHRLYILMRHDIDNMNPGKGMAQASHASLHAHKEIQANYRFEPFREAWAEWLKQADGFGTTIVLEGATLSMMMDIDVDHQVPKEAPYAAGIVYDPTYPTQNYYGASFVRSDATCMWVFVPYKDDAPTFIVPALSTLQLHR